MCIGYNFCFLFKFFVPKNMFLKVLRGGLFTWTLWVFLLGLPNLNITSKGVHVHQVISLDFE